MSIGDIIGEGLGIHFKQLGKAEREDKIIKALENVQLDSDTRHRYRTNFQADNANASRLHALWFYSPKW